MRIYFGKETLMWQMILMLMSLSFLNREDDLDDMKMGASVGDFLETVKRLLQMYILPSSLNYL